MAAGAPGGSTPESMGKEAEEDEELTTNPFWGFIWAEDDRRGGSTTAKLRAASMVTGDGWGDSGRGEAGLEVGEGGGGGGERLGARDRSRATRGRRSTGGGGSVLLGSSRAGGGKK